MVGRSKSLWAACALFAIAAVRCSSESDDAPATGSDDTAGSNAAGTSGSATTGSSTGGSVPVGTGGSNGSAGSGGTGTGGSGGSGGPGGKSGAGGSGGAKRSDAGTKAPDPCIEAGACPSGVWTNVTPTNADLTNTLGCGNYGTESVQVDPHRPSDLYTEFMCQGIWKSTDYGLSWKGPINTGAQGVAVGDCAGGITIPPVSNASPPIIYQSCIRGAGLGFWRSTNGGVDWARYNVAPGASRQDVYPPVVDPYDANHLLMAGHELNLLVQSTDGGQNWTNVPLDAGMNQNGGTAAIFFIDTGNATTTRTTFLWLAQQSDVYGAWRTTNGGTGWTRVDKNEHPHGSSQIYQPDTGGVVYMAGAYSTLGWGVLRSTDYGATWAHVGRTGNECIVFGTSKYVYSMNGGAIGLGGTLDPTLEVAAQPGTGTWLAPGTPAAMTLGPAQAAVTNDGTHNVIVTASWGAGVWRYVEP